MDVLTFGARSGWFVCSPSSTMPIVIPEPVYVFQTFEMFASMPATPL